MLDSLLIAESNQLVRPKVRNGFVGNIGWRTEFSPYVKTEGTTVVVAKSLGLMVVANVVIIVG